MFARLNLNEKHREETRKADKTHLMILLLSSWILYFRISVWLILEPVFYNNL